MAFMRRKPAALKRPASIAKVMKVMRKAIKKPAVAKMPKKTPKTGKAWQVFAGTREKTHGGLRKADLVKNQRGKVVSKKKAEKGKCSSWIKAVVAAREALGITGFALVGGKTPEGRSLLLKAKTFHKDSTSAHSSNSLRKLPSGLLPEEVEEVEEKARATAGRPGAMRRQRSEVGEEQLPQAGGRVHFSGALMWHDVVAGTCSKPYEEDIHSEYVGVGRYPINDKAFPKAINASFDSVAVDAGTRVTIYSKPNFKGDVLWDRVGPAIVVNSIWKDSAWPFTQGKGYKTKLMEDWKEPLNTIFPPGVRELSSTNMHAWSSGSLIIKGGEAIPQRLDSFEEYGELANPRC